MEEIVWKVCPIADFFEVSTNGDVRLVTRKRIIKPCDNGAGYMYVTKVLAKKKKHYLIHRLVASAFIENPDNLPEVNHKDGNKQNNNVLNLEWCSPSYNRLHAYRSGLAKPSERQKKIARETALKNLPSMREGWKKWYATDEGKRKHLKNANENLKLANKKLTEKRKEK